MKKQTIIWLIAFALAGVLLIAVGLQVQDSYYSTLVTSAGFGMAFSQALQLVRYWWRSQSRNRPRYEEKVREQQINMRDERKIALRHRAGYLTWMLTMLLCFIASFAAALLRAGSIVVGGLFAAGVGQYIAATVLYKYLCKKM